MLLKDFLDEIEITRTKFAQALGMKNVSSLARYKSVWDLNNIKRTKSKRALLFLFEDAFKTENLLDEFIQNCLTSKEEKRNFQKKIDFMIKMEIRNDEIENLSDEIKVNLVRLVSELENVALMQAELLDKLLIFFKVLNNKKANTELLYVLTYLEKMNNHSEFSQFDSEKQKDIEAILYLAFSNNERAKFKQENLQVMETLFSAYENRVEARQELLREQ